MELWKPQKNPACYSQVLEEDSKTQIFLSLRFEHLYRSNRDRLDPLLFSPQRLMVVVGLNFLPLPYKSPVLLYIEFDLFKTRKEISHWIT